MKSSFKKIILFVLIIVIITVIAILVFGKKGTNDELLKTSNVLSVTDSATTSQSTKFLQSLSQVKSINLDTTFFNNTSYQKLVDFSLPIILEDQRLVGRPNPFAPLGTDSFFSEPETKTELDEPIQPSKTDTSSKKK